MNVKDILDGIESATEITPVAFSSTSIQTLPSIAYQLYRTSDDGIKSQWRLQTRITSNTLKETLDIEAKLVEALTTVADEPKFNDCYIAVNGGGTVEDDETGLPQIITYFDINSRR
jgi:hypothetical protein